VWKECLELDYVLCPSNGREFVIVLLTLLSTAFQWERTCHLTVAALCLNCNRRHPVVL
jgi:hypothetical protein